MKLNSFANLLVFSLIAAMAVTGCKKKTGYVTPLPPGSSAPVADAKPTPAMPLSQDPGATGGTGLTSEQLKDLEKSGSTQNPVGKHDGWPQDRETLKTSKVYFAFDSSAVRTGERAKLQTVADYLKANAEKALLIEGHCDERGTEQYNLSLGERRAVSLREELIKLGIDPTRLDTITFGESRPEVVGHDESAWKQNRRGEFVVLSPK